MMLPNGSRIVAAIVLLSVAMVSRDREGLIARHSVKGLPEFEPVTPVLAKLVERAFYYEKTRQDLSRKPNHLYVCKAEEHQGVDDMWTWVYWKEAQAIVLWEPGRAGDDRIYELAWSRRFLRLDRDEVPTEADIRGSTYRITRQDAKAQIRECVQDGDLYVIPALKSK